MSAPRHISGGDWKPASLVIGKGRSKAGVWKDPRLIYSHIWRWMLQRLKQLGAGLSTWPLQYGGFQVARLPPQWPWNPKAGVPREQGPDRSELTIRRHSTVTSSACCWLEVSHHRPAQVQGEKIHSALVAIMFKSL